MYTVVETPTFARLSETVWTADERLGFVSFIAANPDAGDVVPGSGGLRKIRWRRAGQGKRGGVRVIYYNRLTTGEIWLLVVYAKAARDTLPAHVLNQIREELEHA